jgi:hypothetical protein
MRKCLMLALFVGALFAVMVSAQGSKNLVIEPAGISNIEIGETIQFRAYLDGVQVDAKWLLPHDSGAFSITSDGLVTGLECGFGGVRAHYKGAGDFVGVEVTDHPTDCD